MLLTVKEAAAELKVSPCVVYAMVTQRKLRYCRIGCGRGRIRIPDDAIGEYLERCTFGPKKPEAKPEPVPAFKLKHLRIR